MMINIIVLGLVALIFLVGVVILQVFLSKREGKWPGLVIPIMGVVFSLFGVFDMAFYGNESILQKMIAIMVSFFILNIPTFILLAIYFSCHEKVKKNKEIDKMNIQDL